MEDNVKNEKISIGRLFSNVNYCLSIAWKVDKKVVISVYLAFIAGFFIHAVYATLFLKTFIEMLSNRSVSLKITGIFIFGGILFMLLGEAMQIFVEQWATARFIRITGIIQKDFIKKASEIDLLYYDQKRYFEDFVIAAAQSDEMILGALMATAYGIGLLTGIVTVGSIIMTMNPIIALFPIAGFFINIITRFKITKLEYDYDVIYKSLMRKADYSKRVFYQPEYAKEIKLSQVEVPLRKQFDQAIGEIESRSRTYGIKIAILSLINWISVFTILSCLCPPLYLGYLALVKRSIALGEVAAMNNAQEEIRNTLDGLNYAMVEFQRVGQFSQRFRGFLEYKVQIEEEQGTTKVPEGKQVLEIRNVSFRYEGEEEDTLKNISLCIKPGERIAIVGENGAGKTTFVKLLMRLYDVTEGTITYGGMDIRKFNTKEYRNIIGAVFQDFQLYGATLAENVLMGEYEEKEEQRVLDALTLADFSNKLKKLPNGIHTEMTKEFSEQGTMLSGGETQKVAIARMFAKANQLSIAILDEPSSALDPIAEATLTKNMMENAKEGAVIFISHRLSTTKEADHIYMFEHGQIIEQGNHEELMKISGKYADMFEKQAHYYQEELD